MEGRLISVEEKVLGISPIQRDLNIAKETIVELQSANNLQDQLSRQNNLELSGVPSRGGENLNTILSDLCKKVGFILQDTDIDTIHRVRPFFNTGSERNKEGLRHPSIIIRFTQRRRKDQLIAAVRARRGITTADIGIPGPAYNLYLNDHLTPANKLLLKRARELKVKCSYSYLWVRDCKILIRKNDKSGIIRISKESDLQKIR